jgi:hypothetical protein
LPKRLLLEAQNIAICLDVILQPELYKSTSDIIFHERLLHRMKDAFDEPGGRLTGFQRNPIIHFILEVPEKTQVEALKHLTRVRWERDSRDRMICQETQRVQLHMDGTIVHEKDGLLARELFIGSQFLNVGDENG